MYDDCLQYIYNVGMAIEEIQNSVNKNKDSLVEYKVEFERALNPFPLAVLYIVHNLKSK